MTGEHTGRRGARISMADSGIRYAQLALEQQRRAIELRVAQTYWDALRLQYLQTLGKESVGYYREILDYHRSVQRRKDRRSRSASCTAGRSSCRDESGYEPPC